MKFELKLFKVLQKFHSKKPVRESVGPWFLQPRLPPPWLWNLISINCSSASSIRWKLSPHCFFDVKHLNCLLEQAGKPLFRSFPRARFSAVPHSFYSHDRRTVAQTASLVSLSIADPFSRFIASGLARFCRFASAQHIPTPYFSPSPCLLSRALCVGATAGSSVTHSLSEGRLRAIRPK